uniref:tRNA (guanine(9)-N(1))-methyltransferase n=1 Tax=Panagrellus redivivus TaxID=6233 RepID=A0A7E4V8P8_PANRE
MSESTSSTPEPTIKEEPLSWSEKGNNLTEEERRRLGEARNKEWLEAKARGLSKNQWRKEKRQQVKLATRAETRAAERARRKVNKAAKKADGTFVPPPPKKTMAESSLKQKVAIDLDFVEYMNESDLKNSLTQVALCYGTNRRLPQPLQLYACGVNEHIMNLAESIGIFKNWDIHLKSDKIDTVFTPNEIVYLTAESDNVLTELDESKVYIIGGLVDHNHHKGLCHGIATKKGYGHARLAIEENVKLDSRKVLTINHVFDILARYTVHGNWKAALDEVIPGRKRKADSVSGDDASEAKKPELKTPEAVKAELAS